MAKSMLLYVRFTDGSSYSAPVTKAEWEMFRNWYERGTGTFTLNATNGASRVITRQDVVSYS